MFPVYYRYRRNPAALALTRCAVYRGGLHFAPAYFFV